MMQEANFGITALSLEASSFLIEIQLVRKDQEVREAGRGVCFQHRRSTGTQSKIFKYQ